MGESVGSCVGLAYVWDPAGGRVDAAWVEAGSYEVDLAGSRHPATVSLKPLFDPQNAKVRP